MTYLILQILGWIVAIIVSMFIFWRRLVRDWDEQTLWTLIFQMLFAGLTLGRISWWAQILLSNWQSFHLSNLWWLVQVFSHQGWDLWGGLLGAAIIIELKHKIIRHRLISEVGDALVEAFGWGILVIQSLKFKVQSWKQDLVGLSITIISLIIWYWFKKNYRRFRWYLSGKVGFLFCSGIILLGIGQLIVMPVSNSVYGRLGQLLYNGIPIGLGGLILYQLSNRILSNDYLVIKNWWLSLIKLKKGYDQKK